MRQEEQETQSSTSRHSKMNLQSGKYFNEASTQLQIHEKKILKNEDQIQENTNKVLNVSCMELFFNYFVETFYSNIMFRKCDWTCNIDTVFICGVYIWDSESFLRYYIHRLYTGVHFRLNVKNCVSNMEYTYT